MEVLLSKPKPYQLNHNHNTTSTSTLFEIRMTHTAIIPILVYIAYNHTKCGIFSLEFSNLVQIVRTHLSFEIFTNYNTFKIYQNRYFSMIKDLQQMQIVALAKYTRYLCISGPCGSVFQSAHIVFEQPFMKYLPKNCLCNI